MRVRLGTLGPGSNLRNLISCSFPISHSSGHSRVYLATDSSGQFIQSGRFNIVFYNRKQRDIWKWISQNYLGSLGQFLSSGQFNICFLWKKKETTFSFR